MRDNSRSCSQTKCGPKYVKVVYDTVGSTHEHAFQRTPLL